MKNKAITLTQIDAHYCKVDNINEHQLLVWDILSYDVNTRIPGKPGITKDTRSFLDRRGNKFPYGLVDFVTKKLNDEGYEVEVNELDYKFKKVLIPKLKGIVFEDYQKKILKLAGKHQRGIFVAPTGSGKTILAGGIISKYDFPISLFITINKSIFNQTIADFEKWFPEIEIGRVGDSVCEVSHITVALYQSLARWDLRKYNKELELVIVDEIHNAGKSITKILKQFTDVPLRYGLTATPHIEYGNKQKFLEMTGNVGSVVSEVQDDEVKARVVSCDVYMVNYINKNPKGKKYREVFLKDICLSHERNTKLLRAAKLLAINKNKTVLFMVDEISQANYVEKIAKNMNIKTKIAHGKNKRDDNEIIKKMLNDKNVEMVIATAVMKTGTNIPSLDCVVLGSARKSEISMLQAIGRSRRKTDDKDKAIIIDSFDRVIGKGKFYKYFEEYSEGRLELYKEKNWFRKRLLI